MQIADYDWANMSMALCYADDQLQNSRITPVKSERPSS